jgi:excisionase family DNA binding protein
MRHRAPVRPLNLDTRLCIAQDDAVPTANLLTTREVADRCGVHVSTVQRWVERGVLSPARTLPGGKARIAGYLFRASDVRRLIRQRAS